MPAFEAQSSQFSLISGIQQPTSDMVLETVPASFFAPEARKGRLYIFVDIEQEVPRGRDACQLVIQTICKQFYDDSSYSVTSALRKAISAANKALYEQNFSASPQRRAVLGVSCAVIKGSDVYIAQVQPAQAYLHSGTKLRALPPLPTGTTPTGTAMSFKPVQSEPASRSTLNSTARCSILAMCCCCARAQCRSCSIPTPPVECCAV